MDRSLIIRVGASVAALIGGVAVLSLVLDVEANERYRPWLFVAQIVIFAFGGIRAAKHAPQSPITHGAAASAAGLAAIIMITAFARVARGDGVSIIGIVFFLLLAASVGAVAALLWSSRQAPAET